MIKSRATLRATLRATCLVLAAVFQSASAIPTSCAGDGVVTGVSQTTITGSTGLPGFRVQVNSASGITRNTLLTVSTANLAGTPLPGLGISWTGGDSNNVSGMCDLTIARAATVVGIAPAPAQVPAVVAMTVPAAPTPQALTCKALTSLAKDYSVTGIWSQIPNAGGYGTDLGSIQYTTSREYVRSWSSSYTARLGLRCFANSRSIVGINQIKPFPGSSTQVAWFSIGGIIAGTPLNPTVAFDVLDTFKAGGNVSDMKVFDQWGSEVAAVTYTYNPYNDTLLAVGLPATAPDLPVFDLPKGNYTMSRGYSFTFGAYTGPYASSGDTLKLTAVSVPTF